ncbi:hypothetical protein ACFWNL_37270 [Kitasatospora sp. NPDC058397]|uniref:hypothetical protein n=1 Tax=unclassified Kitasatospora TaxID=2633591 RepID=UPI00364D3618
MSFTDGSGHRLDLTALYADLGRRTITGGVSADGGPPHRINLVDCPVGLRNFRVSLSGIDVVDEPCTLTADAADAFATAFGKAPVAAGEKLFDANGHFGIVESLGALPRSLLVS